MAMESNYYGQCDVGGWRDIGPFSKERAEERRLAEAKRWEEQGLCRYCGGTLGGFFTRKCKSCGSVQ
jgi:hypothetical protein